MKYIFFSKMVREQSVAELIRSVKRIGADGVDLAVRPGHPVNPDNVRKVLPETVRQFAEAGLSVPMVSTPTEFNDPKARFAEELWAACHDAGVANVKIGYWSYPGRDYWKLVDAARKQLEGLQNLSTRFGVKACLHTHSGNFVGVNASSVMHLAKGFNPFAIGVYLDPGHLNVNGEPLTMAFDMVSEYLALVAVKDSLVQKGEGAKPRASHFLPLGQGTVDWREMMRNLVARKYEGSLSFHSEYEGMTTDALLDQTRKDIAMIRQIEKEVRGAGA
jgi:sugar phosphate isomerase/epimerase